MAPSKEIISKEKASDEEKTFDEYMAPVEYKTSNENRNTARKRFLEDKRTPG
jgi:hypothetical protein